MRSRPASTTRACRLPSRSHARSTATSRRSSKPRAKPQRVVWPLVVPGYDFSSARAGVAHLVERDLAKVEVAGSKPASRSSSVSLRSTSLSRETGAAMHRHRVCSQSAFESGRLPLFPNTRCAIYGLSSISRARCTRFWGVARAPLIPPALTRGPFNLEESRRHGLTKDHLLGSSWHRLGGGFHALRAIADEPDVVLAAIGRRPPSGAVFSGRSAGWLHGLDIPPCDPVEVTVPSASQISRLTGIAVRRSDIGAGETVTRRGYPATSMGSHTRRSREAPPSSGRGCGSRHALHR